MRAKNYSKWTLEDLRINLSFQREELRKGSRFPGVVARRKKLIKSIEAEIVVKTLDNSIRDMLK